MCKSWYLLDYENHFTCPYCKCENYFESVDDIEDIEYCGQCGGEVKIIKW